MNTRYGDRLDNAFDELGVKAAERNTKAYRIIKEAIENHPEILIGESLGETLKEAANISAVLKSQSGTAREMIVMDSKLRDAVAGFNATIRAVKDVFGEEALSEAVICKAIEAGSYIGHRAIMGEAATVRR